MRPFQQPEFPTTRWSRVLAVRGSADDPAAVRALSELCEAYWYPLYAFARRLGHDAHEAEDLTQSFFAVVLSSELFARADPLKGRLRSYLLGAFRNFIGMTARDNARIKRGGNVDFVPLDFGKAEELYSAELADELTPDVLFERSWAQTLLKKVLSALEQEYARRQQQAIFTQLQDFLVTHGDPGPVQKHAAALGMNEGAVRVAVHRLRQRYRRLLEDMVADTVPAREEVADELRHLAQVFSTRAT